MNPEENLEKETTPKCMYTDLNKVLRPEISPQIDNLPRPKTNQHAHRPKRKPLHPLVGALIGITQSLLPRPQVLHFRDDVGNNVFNAAKVCLDGLELLLRLDAGPVAGVGADLDVEFDFAGGVRAG